jgi:hypothetical protein
MLSSIDALRDRINLLTGDYSTCCQALKEDGIADNWPCEFYDSGEQLELKVELPGFARRISISGCRETIRDQRLATTADRWLYHPSPGAGESDLHPEHDLPDEVDSKATA